MNFNIRWSIDAGRYTLDFNLRSWYVGCMEMEGFRFFNFGPFCFFYAMGK